MLHTYSGWEQQHKCVHCIVRLQPAGTVLRCDVNSLSCTCPWGWTTGWQHASYLCITTETDKFKDVTITRCTFTWLKTFKHTSSFLHCPVCTLLTAITVLTWSQYWDFPVPCPVCYVCMYMLWNSCEALSLQYFHVSDCNVQCANRTRNTERLYKSLCTFNTQHTVSTVCIYICMYTYTVRAALHRFTTQCLEISRYTSREAQGPRSQRGIWTGKQLFIG